MASLFYPLDVYMNVILVNNDIRPAMLVQEADYIRNTKQFDKIIENIKNLFPNLILTFDYNIYQGIIVSKKDYTGRNDVSLSEMGHILGYPCADEFETNDSNTKYNFSINAVIEDDGEVDEIQLIPNICKSVNKRSQFENIARDAKNVFERMGLTFVKDVIVKVRAKVPKKLLIHKLKNNEPLSEEEIYELDEILENFDFDRLRMKHFNVNDCIHRGILIGLILRYENEPLSPFFPIQYFPQQQQQVKNITIKLEKSIYSFLKN
jgi:hypothetical protein